MTNCSDFSYSDKFNTTSFVYLFALPNHAYVIYGCKNDNFQMKNCDIFLIFAQNIDCGYTLEPPSEAVLTSTHTLCLRAKIRK